MGVRTVTTLAIIESQQLRNRSAIKANQNVSLLTTTRRDIHSAFLFRCQILPCLGTLI